MFCLLGGLLLLLTAGLAASPPVAADFDRQRIAGEVRERRRREQERRDHGRLSTGRSGQEELHDR